MTAIKTNTLTDSSDELAFLMKQSPQQVEKELIQNGENLVGIFEDPNYTHRRFQNLNRQKIEVLKSAIDDIGVGVMVLRSSNIGLNFKGKDIQNYISPHGSNPSGTVVFSVNWKNIAAFKNWRHGEGDDVSQNDINAAIYFLTFQISKYL